MTDDQAAALLEAIDELRSELARIRRQGLVARLSDAEREEIADRVFERVDERLAPADSADLDDAPARRRTSGRKFLRN